MRLTIVVPAVPDPRANPNSRCSERTRKKWRKALATEAVMPKIAINPGFSGRIDGTTHRDLAPSASPLTVLSDQESAVSQSTEKRCLNCGELIPIGRLTVTSARVIYCSPECGYAYRQPIKREVPLATATVGAISELVVAVDLLRRGHETFRALSAACGCDLVAFVDGRAVRIEVRSGQENRDGTFSCAFGVKDTGRADMFAVVLRETEIIYWPDRYGWNTTQHEPTLSLRLKIETSCVRDQRHGNAPE